ncbi:MAG TPA: cyclic nucleotide-binding domain-containing protein, partial [Anaerolineales bacterium]|nr:cyclic nucleotide-binding domain-containing protein [Anaerolineales bacterium]
MSDTSIIDKIAILRQTFDGLTEEELAEIAHLTHLREFPVDYILCREGAFEDTFYIMAAGQAVVTKKISDHEGERVLRNQGPGDFVGEMAIIQNAPRAATVRVTAPATVLEMGKADFEAMLRRSPRLALSIFRTTLNRMRANDQMSIQDLQRTNKILRQLDRNKLEFIQVAAHELRTPLTVLKGNASVMKAMPQIKENSALAEVLDGIVRGADRMHEIVNMMLDITRIDSDTLRIATSLMPIRSVVNDTAHDFQKGAKERGLTISIEHAPDTPNINADPTLIQKALYQIIMNAIKYTPDGGGITIRTRPVLLERDQPGIEISIRDAGIGLDAEHQELIFEKFYQVGSVALHSSSKAAFKGGGPGLGLAIARGV